MLGGKKITQRNLAKAAIWWKAFRYHFVPPSIFPATLGALVAWAIDRSFYPLYFIIVIVGVVLNHLALNMADDYFDYKHSVDQLKQEEKNPYTGGSGTLTSGFIKPSAMRKAFSLCFMVTIILGVFLTLTRGLPVLFFGLFGVFCAFFYTAPPINFSHYSLGEVSQLINFGTTIGLGSYFVQTQKISFEAFVATLPLGIMLFSMIIINEIPDYQEDRLAGKITLVARYGKENGVKMYVASWVCTYAIIILAALLGVMPVWTLIALASMPLTFRSIRTLKRNFENPSGLAPANLDMIKAHSITSFGLIAAYAISGVACGANVIQLMIIVLVLVVAYSPAVLVMRKPKNKTPA